MMIGKATPQFNEVPTPYNTAQQQYNTGSRSIRSRNHTIIPHSITKRPSTIHYEEIKLATEVEEEEEEALEEE